MSDRGAFSSLAGAHDRLVQNPVRMSAHDKVFSSACKIAHDEVLSSACMGPHDEKLSDACMGAHDEVLSSACEWVLMTRCATFNKLEPYLQ